MNSATTTGSRYGAIVGSTPTVTVPRNSSRASPASRCAASTSSRIRAARRRNASPCGVSFASRFIRSNSRSPSSSSSLRICWLSDGCDTWHCSAAREKLRVRATATMYRS